MTIYKSGKLQLKMTEMQDSFEILEWESTSKEQDSLIHHLFGDISSKNGKCSTSLASNGSLKNGVGASESKKRKATESNNKTGQLKKKRKKKKRDNNKFKTEQRLGSECPGNERGDANVMKEQDLEVDKATSNYTGPVEKALEQERIKKLNRRKSRKEKKDILMSQSDEEDSNEHKKKDQIKGVSDNRCHKSTDPTCQACTDNEGIASDLETTAGVNQSGINKAKTKRRREKNKGDDNGHVDNSTIITNSEQTAPEANQKQRRKKKKKDREQDLHSPYEESVAGKNFENPQVTSENIHPPSALQSKSSLHEKMTKQLESSRFRWINEQLYTTTGKEAAEMFSEDPNLFDIYHKGFNNQVRLWPVNPVDKIIEWLKKRY